MTVYAINFGASYTNSGNQGDLNDLSSPLPSPWRVVPIEPDLITKANGLVIENGPFGWTLIWDEASVTDLEIIYGKISAVSITGYLRIWDRVPRYGGETWSVYTCTLVRPTKPEYRAGPTRYNVQVQCLDLELYEELAA